MSVQNPPEPGTGATVRAMCPHCEMRFEVLDVDIEVLTLDTEFLCHFCGWRPIDRVLTVGHLSFYGLFEVVRR